MTGAWSYRTCFNCGQNRDAGTGRWWLTRNGRRWLCKHCSDRRIVARRKARLRGRVKPLGVVHG
jgi:DNA-directed RNA polymerase subunit RPC12/RpoP